MMENALMIFLLAVPIVCLVGGSIYCAICLLKSYTTHTLKDEDDISVESACVQNESTDEECVNSHAMSEPLRLSGEENDDLLFAYDVVVGRTLKANYVAHLFRDEDDDSIESVCVQNESTDEECVNSHTMSGSMILSDGKSDDLLFAQEKQAKRKKVIRQLIDSMYIRNEKSNERPKRISLLKNKNYQIWLVCECLLYILSAIVVILTPIISGEQVAEHDISLKECVISVIIAILTIGCDLLISSVDFSKISGWRSIGRTIFSRPVLLSGIGLVVLCVVFFSHDITYWLSSSGNILLFSCGVISFLLIGSAVLSCTRKMLEYA